MTQHQKKILHILEQGAGYVSGESLAEQLGVSRAAVWKEIDKLRKDGYTIDSRTNKGYLLDLETDLLDAEKIAGAMKSDFFQNNILIYDVVDSTNNELRRLAAECAPEGTVVFADKQTGGKGRRGRGFVSPRGRGIYMSLLLRPDLPIDRVQLITIIAALSVADAIEETAGIAASVKWVNDVLFRGRKLCGILTEGNFSGESGQIEFLVIGIGINVGSVKEFPEEVRSIVTSVYDAGGKHVRRCDLAARVLDRFADYYEMLKRDDRSLLITYRNRLNVLGKKIEVLGAREQYLATALDVSERGGLIVRRLDGRVEELNSGEISTRLMDVRSE